MKTYKIAKKIASAIQQDVITEDLICIEEPERARSQIIPENLAKTSQQYVQKIIREINGTYEKGYFTACAVMIRRLLETLMIEAFEKKGLASLIKDNNEYKTAEKIRNKLLENPFGNISRNAKRALQNKDLFELGNKCAHDRFFIARKSDIDGIKGEARNLIEYLIYQSI